MFSKSTRIVRTFLMFAPLALLVTLSANAQMVNQSRPYSGTTQNPCNGEMVNFSGTIHFHEKTQISADGRIHYVANNNFNASGVGQSTRVTYNIGGTMNTNSKFPSYPIKFNQRSRFISTSSAAPSFHSTFAFHVNGAGVQTQVTTTSDCKG
jgi:hypothetical protein